MRSYFDVSNWISLWPRRPFCAQRGMMVLFSKDFEDETVGSPTATPPIGPAGVDFRVAGPDGTHNVIGTGVSNKALQLTRGNSLDTRVEAIPSVGVDSQERPEPIKEGKCYIDFNAFSGEKAHPAGAAMISVDDSSGQQALKLYIHSDRYHLQTDASTETTLWWACTDIKTTHRVHIELDLDARRYSICINNRRVVVNRPYLDSGFSSFNAVVFLINGAITEANSNTYVIDDLLITR